MRNFTTPWLTATCLSALSSYYWPALPPRYTLVGLFVTLTLLITYIAFRRVSLRNHWLFRLAVITHGAVLGALWMASVGHWYYQWQLPRNKIQQDVRVTGTVISASCHGKRHHYTIKTDFNTPGGQRLVRVFEQTPLPCLQHQDSLTATIRIKPAYGVANPIGFNYQQFLASQSIVASGTIRHRHRVIRSSPSVRRRVSSLISAHNMRYGRWLHLLVLGDKTALKEKDWSLLRRTGTGHLFSISGLHVGIVAATLVPVVGLLAACIGRIAAVRTSFTYTASAIAIVTIMWGYVVLTGQALPVVRAWLLVLIALALSVCQRHCNGLQTGLIMLAGCLLLFPMAILAAGFHLSVGAVLAIWFLCWRWRWYQLRWYAAMWRIQLSLTLLLLPAVIGWFGIISLSSVPLNVLLVPMMSILLPMILLAVLVAAVVSPVSANVLWLADRLVGVMIETLAMLDSYLPAAIDVSLGPAPTAALLLAILTYCLPAFRYRHGMTLLLLLPALLNLLPLNTRLWYVHVMDAGQGTAVLVSRGHKAIVIDTGAASPGGAPTVEKALIPLIEHYGLTVEFVIISHGDNDHAGGVPALRAFLAEQQQATTWIQPHDGCHAGRNIQWQGLSLLFHWPEDNSNFTGNNASCVLSIAGHTHRVLFPGDIERSAEYALLATTADIRSQVLIAPHHGSATSSTEVFLDRVGAGLVIFTQGDENRWGFPAETVVTRNRVRGARMLATSETGYIRLSLEENAPVTVNTLRHDIRKRWYLRPKSPQNINLKE